jgi:hypothetical protein
MSLISWLILQKHGKVAGSNSLLCPLNSHSINPSGHHSIALRITGVNTYRVLRILGSEYSPATVSKVGF